MRRHDVDVVVVGAGPAGVATALHLARRGHSVRILDRSTFPRPKVCGEGLMPHGVHELGLLGLRQGVEALAAPFTGIAYHAAGHEAVGRFPGHEDGRHGLGVHRERFDAFLLDAVRREPAVEVTLGMPVRGLQWSADAVTAATDAGDVRARVVVGADGLGSMVRRAAGLARRVADAPRYGARLHYALQQPVRDVVDVWVGDGLELYLTPVGPREVNVALLCGRDVSRGLAGDLTGKLDALFRGHPALAAMLDGAETLDEAGLCGPLRQVTSDQVADRLVLVGDAAGFIDGITGEGMSLTLMGARLAAQTLDACLRADTLDRRALVPYAVARHRASRDLVWLTEMVLWGVRRPRVARWFVRNLARHPETFDRFLAVNSGQRRLLSISPRDLIRVGLGV